MSTSTKATRTREEPRTEEASTREASVPGDQGARTRGGPKRLLRSRDDRVIAGVARWSRSLLPGRSDDLPDRVRPVHPVRRVRAGGLHRRRAVHPDDNGSAAIAPGGRLGTAGRIVGIGGLVVVGLVGLAVLSTGAAFVTGLGYGLAVVALIAILALTLIVLSFRGGVRWLIAPALALSVGSGSRRRGAARPGGRHRQA